MASVRHLDPKSQRSPRAASPRELHRAGSDRSLSSRRDRESDRYRDRPRDRDRDGGYPDSRSRRDREREDCNRSVSPLGSPRSRGADNDLTLLPPPPPPVDIKKALQEYVKKYPFLADEGHDLHIWMEACEDALANDDVGVAWDAFGRLEQGVEQEEQTLEAAFHLFVPPGKDFLDKAQVKVMLEYLGFPSERCDVDAVMKAVDTDGDGTMSLSEFQMYVGRMGGSFKLFEVRRQQMAAKHGTKSGAKEPALLAEDLKAAGITVQEQAYWSLVLPRAAEEFEEAARLTACQRKAVRHIRQLAKGNHERALPSLQRKVAKLGFGDNDLWMTLAYIRELAPIIIHLSPKKMMEWMEKDTHYRNQFETATSGGLLKPAVRQKWERDLYGGCYDKATGFERCKYGVLNCMNDYRGVVKCAQYGDSYIVLKDMRLRCTFSPEDSANLKADRLAVLDYYAHVLAEYSKDELRETIMIAKSGEAALLGDSSKVGNMKYKETQIHGEVRWDSHVERLVAHVKYREKGQGDRLKAICKKWGWKFAWMDEERKRMELEEKATLGEDAWKAKLKAIMEKKAPDVPGVPCGFCRKGCGRKVQPGKTPSGNDFSTCCRGCALGFGHDMNCGNIDPELIKPGLCLNGCGRPVNKGKSPSGRPFLTCCRGCARGTHDVMCGKSSDLCINNCGRKVAPPRNGRVFNTCCAECGKSRGREHHPRCGH